MSISETATPSVATAASRIEGYYINLDRSPDRRESMERQIKALGLEKVYRRFPAIDGAPAAYSGRLRSGEVGCFHSHAELMRRAKPDGKIIHVLEDDSLLSEFFFPAVCHTIDSGAFERYDLIYTDIHGIFELRHLQQLKWIFEETAPARIDGSLHNKLRMVDLAPVNFLATSSYLINPASADRLKAIISKEISEGLSLPIDHLIRREVNARRLRAAVIFPYVSTIDLTLASATLSGRDMRDAHTAMRLMRYSFFINRDLDGQAGQILAEILARNETGRDDRHHAFLLDICSYMISRHFRLG